MIFRPLFALSIAAFALASSLARAQAPAPPAPAPAASPVAIPPHTCVKPEFPGRLASTSHINEFNKQVNAYGACIRNYVNEVKAIANAATAAGNSAIDEYNTYSEEMKAKIEAAKE